MPADHLIVSPRSCARRFRQGPRLRNSIVLPSGKPGRFGRRWNEPTIKGSIISGKATFVFLATSIE